MKRLVRHPVLSTALAASWLALNGVSPGHAVLALALAAAVPPAVDRLLGPAAVRFSGRPALELLAIVLWDIAVANVRVARLVLGPIDVLRPHFVRVPLEACDERAVTLLARIVTITPGTTTVGIGPGGRHILVHVLHADDPAAVVGTIKARYERRVKEIFVCSTSPA